MSVLRTEPPAPVSIPPGRPTEGRDATGKLWRRVWSLSDRLVIEFIGTATAEVRDPAGSVVFDRPLPASVERHLVRDHILPLWLARGGDLVVHAGLVKRSGRAILLVGQSGAGKSTLVAYCGRRGWTIGGDDAVVLRPDDSSWVAAPAAPSLRLTAESLEILGISAAGSESAGKWEVAGPVGTWERAVPVERILVIQPAPPGSDADHAELRGVAAHAALFAGVFRADEGDAAALDAVVDRVARVVESVPVGRLAVPRGPAGLVAVERRLRELSSPDPASG